MLIAGLVLMSVAAVGSQVNKKPDGHGNYTRRTDWLATVSVLLFWIGLIVTGVACVMLFTQHEDRVSARSGQ